MTQTVLILVTVALLGTASASPLSRLRRGFFVAPAGGAAFQKSVYVSVGGVGGGAGGAGADSAAAGGGAGGSAGGGGELVVAKPMAPVTVLKPVAVPVPYPVPVPVEVPVEAERPAVANPVVVDVQKPAYVQSGGGGSAGAVAGTFHISAGNLFDNIFNIPISVLRSVNQFLNNNLRGGATVHVNAVKGYHYGSGGSLAPAPAPAPAQTAVAGSSSSSSASASSESQSSAASDSSSSAGTSASSSSSSSASASGAVGGTLYKRRSPTFYNDIFNIPVSALTSVNTLLTGGK